MDRTNILNIVDEMNNTIKGCNIGITFLSNKPENEDEPNIIITYETGANIKITFYLTEHEASIMTFYNLKAILNILTMQEVYRRKVIFKNAVISAKP